MELARVLQRFIDNKDSIINLLAVGSGVYILGNLVSYLRQMFKTNSNINQMKKIIKSEKQKYLLNTKTNKNSNESKLELAYLCYLKILYGLYHTQFITYDRERSSLFLNKDLDKYMNCVDSFNHNLKIEEQFILKEIKVELAIDESLELTELKKEDKSKLIEFEYLIYLTLEKSKVNITTNSNWTSQKSSIMKKQ